MKLFSIAIALSVSTANGFTTLCCSIHGSRCRCCRRRRPLTPPTTLGMDSTTCEALATAAVESKGIAMDAIALNYGYMAIPLTDAEIGAVLFGSQLTYYAKDPNWINRDRFILSAGQGAMFLYTWLHLAGFDISMDELKNHRVLGSMTPGYPEFQKNIPGVEGTTGPLGGGQGIANAVGMAASEKMAAAIYNTDEHTIFDHHIFVLAMDGCLQEGVSAETAAFAAHEKLDNLIVLYSSSGITLDKMVEYTQSEDVLMRYHAYGWDTYEIDGHDLEVIDTTIASAKANNNGKPKLIKCNTIPGNGMEEIEGTNAAYAEAGIPYIFNAKRNMGLPERETFYVSKETRALFLQICKENEAVYNQWMEVFDGWEEANPELALQLRHAVADHTLLSADEMLNEIPPLHVTDDEAIRVSGNTVIQWIATFIPHYVTGSADKTGSARNYINNGMPFGGSGFDKTYAGKNLYYGNREHGMGSIMNGFAYHGLFKISGSTFASHMDYMRLPLRIAALSELQRISYILTHESIGASLEGPLHQPIELISNLRDIPNLDVYRPADAEETVAAMVSSATREDGPTALLFSNRPLPQINEIDYMVRREGALKGGYIVKKEEVVETTANSSWDLIIIIATGSEVSLALEVGKEFPNVRVVSMPCVEAFERQSKEYQEEIIPSSCPTARRIAFEGGTTRGWYKYASEVIGIDRFGISAPAEVVRIELGMTADNLRSHINRM